MRSNVTLESLNIFKNLIGGYKKTFDQSDLETTKNLVSKGDALRFETLDQRIGMLVTMTQFDLPNDYVAVQSRALKNLELDQVHKLLNTYLVEPDLTYVVVGDAETQLEKVSNFAPGRPAMLNRLGEPVQALD